MADFTLKESTMRRLMEMAGQTNYTTEVITESKKSKLIREFASPEENKDDDVIVDDKPPVPASDVPAAPPTDDLAPPADDFGGDLGAGGDEGGTVTVNYKEFASKLADLLAMGGFGAKITVQVDGQPVTPESAEGEFGDTELPVDDGMDAAPVDDVAPPVPEAPPEEEKKPQFESKAHIAAANMVYESIIEKLTGVKLSEAKKKGTVDVKLSQTAKK